MWLLLGLVGLVAASGVGGLFLRADDEADELLPPDAGPSDTDLASETGDLLDFADPAVIDVSPPLDQAVEDEGSFISTDTDQPPPDDLWIDMGDGGGAAAGGDGSDTLLGGDSRDWIEGGDGHDLLVGGGGDDSLWGGNGDDTLEGGTGADSLVGGGGNNRLMGADGADLLRGGADRDTLLGGADHDTLEGGAGDDHLVGGTGADLLMGGDGNDRLTGADVMDSDDAQPDTLNGGAGDDVLVLSSGDLAMGGEGNDTFLLGDWIDPGDPATLGDFTSGRDLILIGHESGSNAPAVETRFDPQTESMQVLLDGRIIALLPGVQSLTADDVTLIALHPPQAPTAP